MQISGQRRPNLRMCQYNGTTQTATAAVFSLIGLFNNSTGRDLIVVHHLDISAPTAQTYGWYTLNAQLATTVAGSVQVVTGEPLLAGQLQTGTIAALPTNRTHLTIPGSNFYQWVHDYPLAVLLPGWSLITYCGTVDITLNADFFWETVPAELYWQMLDEYYLGNG
jgi:hypothetical protein